MKIQSNYSNKTIIYYTNESSFQEVINLMYTIITKLIFKQPETQDSAHIIFSSLMKFDHRYPQQFFY